MKKVLFVFALMNAMVSCKKETTTPNKNGNNSVDTTSQSVNTPLISAYK